MPNWVENRLSVIGSPEQVSAFVEALRGPAEVDLGGENATERSIIAAVRDGVSVAQAFEDANRRVDVLRDQIGELHVLLDDGELRVTPVSAAAFEAWAAEVESKIEPDHDTQQSAISFGTIVPPPSAIVEESFHLVGYHWAIKNWGVKWGCQADAPAIIELPDGRAQASYPVFDTANNSPLAAILAASKAHPDLTLFSFSMDADNDQFDFHVLRAGEAVEEKKFARDEIPAGAIERDEPEDGDSEWVSGSKLFEICVYDAMVELEDAPGMSR